MGNILRLCPNRSPHAGTKDRHGTVGLSKLISNLNNRPTCHTGLRRKTQAVVMGFRPLGLHRAPSITLSLSTPTACRKPILQEAFCQRSMLNISISSCNNSSSSTRYLTLRTNQPSLSGLTPASSLITMRSLLLLLRAPLTIITNSTLPINSSSRNIHHHRLIIPTPFKQATTPRPVSTLLLQTTNTNITTSNSSSSSSTRIDIPRLTWEDWRRLWRSPRAKGEPDPKADLEMNLFFNLTFHAPEH